MLRGPHNIRFDVHLTVLRVYKNQPLPGLFQHRHKACPRDMQIRVYLPEGGSQLSFFHIIVAMLPDDIPRHLTVALAITTYLATYCFWPLSMLADQHLYQWLPG